MWPKPTHRPQSPRGAYYALRAFYCRLKLDLPLQLLHCPRKSKPLSRSSKSRSRSREKEGERARTRSTSFPFRSCKYRSLIKKNPSISLGSIIIIVFFFFLSFQVFLFLCGKLAMSRASSGLAYPERFYAAASYAGFGGSPNPSSEGAISKFQNDVALLLYGLHQQVSM